MLQDSISRPIILFVRLEGRRICNRCWHDPWTKRSMYNSTSRTSRSDKDLMIHKPDFVYLYFKEVIDASDLIVQIHCLTRLLRLISPARLGANVGMNPGALVVAVVTRPPIACVSCDSRSR